MLNSASMFRKFVLLNMIITKLKELRGNAESAFVTKFNLECRKNKVLFPGEFYSLRFFFQTCQFYQF